MTHNCIVRVLIRWCILNSMKMTEPFHRHQVANCDPNRLAHAGQRDLLPIPTGSRRDHAHFRFRSRNTSSFDVWYLRDSGTSKLGRLGGIVGQYLRSFPQVRSPILSAQKGGRKSRHLPYKSFSSRGYKQVILLFCSCSMEISTGRSSSIRWQLFSYHIYYFSCLLQKTRSPSFPLVFSSLVTLLSLFALHKELWSCRRFQRLRNMFLGTYIDQLGTIFILVISRILHISAYSGAKV